MPQWKIWLHGLIAAAVGSAAGGFGSIAGSLVVGDGIWHGLKVACFAALLSAAISVAAYLKQSPVPPGWDGTDRRGTADASTPPKAD